MDFIIRMSDKNETQVVLTYFGGLASSDVAKEFILFFFVLLNLSITVAIMYQFAKLMSDNQSIIRPNSVILAVLMSPVFIILGVFLSHHLLGWPDIHRSSYSSLEIGGYDSWAIILWTSYLLITIIEHIAQKRGGKIIIVSLGLLGSNMGIFISHNLIGIPAVIY